MGIFDSLLGNTSAEAAAAAAADTYRKQKQAAEGIMAFGNTQPALYQELGQAFSPYVQGGQTAYNQLLAGLMGGPGQQQAIEAFQNAPGYQAALKAGLDAVGSKYNAGDMGQSGAAMKALSRYGIDYTNRGWGDYLSRLMGLGQQGLGATGQQVGTQAQGLQNQLATRQSGFQGLTAAAPTVGQGMIAGAQAKQQGLQNVLGLGANLLGTIGGTMWGGGPFGGGGGGSLFGGGGAPLPYGSISNPYGGVPNPTFF